jgi:hypothetical protein
MKSALKIVLALAILTFIACTDNGNGNKDNGGNGENYSEKIVGVWLFETSGGALFYFVFNEDGSGTEYFVYEIHERFDIYHLHWNSIENLLFLNFESGKRESTPFQFIGEYLSIFNNLYRRLDSLPDLLTSTVKNNNIVQ